MDERGDRRTGPGRPGWLAGLGALVVLMGAVALEGGLPRIVGDSPQYLLLADNLAGGHGLSLSREAPYEPTAIRGPGYPLFVVLSTLGLKLPLAAVVLVQVLLQAGIAVLVTWLLTGAGVRRGVAVAAGVAAALLPPSVAAALTLLTESVSSFLGMAGAAAVAVAVLRSRREGGDERLDPGPWVLGGLLAGFGALVRPELLGAAVLLAPVAVVSSGALKLRALRSAVLAVAVALVILPWGVRNYVQLGRPVVTAAVWEWVPRGYARWVETWMDHPRYVQGAYWDVWPFGRYDPDAFPAKAFDDAEERALVDSLLSRYAGPELTGSSADSVIGALARKRMREHPFRTLVVVPLRRIALTVTYLPTSMAGTDSPLKVEAPSSLGDVFSPRHLPLEVAVAVTLLVFLGGAAGSAVAFLPGFRWALPFALLFGFRIVVVGWVAHPDPRYVFLALPPAVLLSTLAAHRILR